MKLSLPIIEDELKETFDVLLPFEGDPSLRLLPPFLYEDGSMERDRVYVLPPDKEPPLAGCDGAVAICTAQTACVPGKEYGCTVVYTNAESAGSLLNQIQKIFEKYEAWEKGMSDILTEDRNTIQKLLDLSAKIHRNMFFLQDSSFVCISIAYDGSFDAEEKWNLETILSILGEPLPDEGMESIRKLFPARRQSRAVMYHPETEFKTLDIPLFDGTIYIGMLSMLQYNRSFEKKDYSILEFLSNYIAFAMSRNSTEPSSNTMTLTSLLTDLLESKHIPKKKIQRVLTAVGFEETDRFVAVVIDFPSDEKALYSNYLRQRIVTDVKNAAACKKDRQLVAVVNESRQPRNGNPWLDSMYQYAQNYGLRIGVSDRFINFRYCELYYEEASAALALLPQSSSQGVYFFRDYSIPYILENCSGKLLPEMLYSEGFRRLLEYEDSASVSYIETLRVFLEENLNAARTARRLYISRNTFLGRYERLCDVLQEDLTDPDVRFRLELSLRLFEYNHRETI